MGSAGGALIAFDNRGQAWSLFWPAATASAVLFVVGVCIARYLSSAEWYSKMHEGDQWLHAVKASRVEYLASRELELDQRIAALREDFEAEKAALEELREERIAEERMAGYVRGLIESSALKAYHANPRNRLRVVSEPDEESA